MNKSKKIIRETGQPDVPAAYEPIVWKYTWPDLLTGKFHVRFSQALEELIAVNYFVN
jgi:hypothetical protein